MAGIAFRAIQRKPLGGADGLMGEIGVVTETVDPEGLIFVHGETWRAFSEEKMEGGEKAEVTAIKGLLLQVKRPGECCRTKRTQSIQKHVPT